MRIHHVGVAVASIDEVLDDYVALGFTVGARVLDEGRRVDIAFVRNGDYVIELVAPAAPDSPVDGLLKKVGPSPYHLCYVVDDIASAVALRTSGYVRVTAPSPAPAIGYASVAFLHHRRVGLIELVELTTRLRATWSELPRGTHDPRRDPHRRRSGRDVTQDHRSGADGRAVADGDAAEDHASLADEDAVPDADGAHRCDVRPVALGRVVGARDEGALADEGPRADLDPVEGVDVDEVSEDRAVADHDRAAVALAREPHLAADLDVGPHEDAVGATQDAGVHQHRALAEGREGAPVEGLRHRVGDVPAHGRPRLGDPLGQVHASLLQSSDGGESTHGGQPPGWSHAPASTATRWSKVCSARVRRRPACRMRSAQSTSCAARRHSSTSSSSVSQVSSSVPGS